MSGGLSIFNRGHKWPRTALTCPAMTALLQNSRRRILTQKIWKCLLTGPPIYYSDSSNQPPLTELQYHNESQQRMNVQKHQEELEARKMIRDKIPSAVWLCATTSGGASDLMSWKGPALRGGLSPITDPIAELLTGLLTLSMKTSRTKHYPHDMPQAQRSFDTLIRVTCCHWEAQGPNQRSSWESSRIHFASLVTQQERGHLVFFMGPAGVILDSLERGSLLQCPTFNRNLGVPSSVRCCCQKKACVRPV